MNGGGGEKPGKRSSDVVPDPQESQGTEVSGDRRHAQIRAVCREVAAKCDLPPFPKVIARAIALTAAPDADGKDVARVISGDPALAARVLHLARSATYCQRQPPRTVVEAVFTVGFATVRQLLVAAGACTLHARGDATARRLWAHALATALAADELRPPGEPRGGESFVAGLLHDIGRLVFHLSDPDAFDRLPYFDQQLEREAYGVSHAALGGYLADTWGMDVKVAHAIFEHHIPLAHGLAARLVRADWIAHRLGLGSTEGEIALAETVDEDQCDLEPIVERVAQAFEAERQFFD
jgi:HD-like signal output (HDOD) protein